MTSRGAGAALMMVALLGVPLLAQEPLGRPTRQSPLAISPLRGIFGFLIEGPFLQPSGIYFDPHQKELFVCDGGARRIAIVNSRGVPTFSIGSRHTLVSPKRVAVAADGRIFVADSGHEAIRVFDYDGSLLPDIELPGTKEGDQPVRPVALALDAEETLYVLDGNNKRVIALASDGSSDRGFRAPPGRADLLRSPVDLELTPDGNLAISDAAGRAVQIYTPSGQLLHAWGDHDVGAFSFSLPGGLAVDEAGRVYVADTLRQDIKVFSAEGDFITNFGGFGNKPGEVLYPVDVAADRAGHIFVAESTGRRVQIFDVHAIPGTE